jgi:hypothetical protein
MQHPPRARDGEACPQCGSRRHGACGHCGACLPSTALTMVGRLATRRRRYCDGRCRLQAWRVRQRPDEEDETEPHDKTDG